MKQEQADKTLAQQPIEYVALGRLTTSPHNVRRKKPTGIEALAENIASQGMLQNLVVHGIAANNTSEVDLGVCAGQRRLLALQMLMTAGRIDADYLVPVKIVSEGEAVAASLIENQQHEPMHPADLCMAFRRLVDEGRTVPYIAALFSMPERAVQRQMKLASVSPKLLEVFREDGMTYEQAAALALTDDHALQEQLWFDAPDAWTRAADQLREAITQTEIDASKSPLVGFVTLEAYEAAGGVVRRDLFSDAKNAGYVTDPALLNRLVVDKLAELTRQVSAEGWSWVEARLRRDWSEMARYRRMSCEARQPNRKEKSLRKALQKTLDEAQAALDSHYASTEPMEDDDAREDALQQTVEQAQQALDAFDASLQAWTDEQKAQGGAFVIVGNNGVPVIERGLIRSQGAASTANGSATGAVAEAQAAKKAKPLHSESLCNRLTAHRTAAVQAELLKQPSMALALLMHRLIPKVFPDNYDTWRSVSAVEIDATTSADKLHRMADDLGQSSAWLFIEGERAKWSAMLPSRYRDLLPWLLVQSDDIMASLFAFCVAATVNGVSATDSAHAINAVSEVLALDMTQYWEPTRASYLDHVPKQRLVDVVTEAVSIEAAKPLMAMKKQEAAEAAQLRLAGTKWLPEVLRNRDVPPLGDGEDDDQQETLQQAA